MFETFPRHGYGFQSHDFALIVDLNNYFAIFGGRWFCKVFPSCPALIGSVAAQKLLFVPETKKKLSSVGQLGFSVFRKFHRVSAQN